MGIAVGLAIAVVIYKMHFYLPTTPSIDAVLTIMTPYVMYLVAEQFHFSGVLAVVSGGLFLSSCSHRFLNYQSRIHAAGVWGSLIFLLNGLVFILIGLQLPSIIDGLGEYSIAEAVFYAIVVSLTVIVVRILYVYLSAYTPLILSKKIRETGIAPSAAIVFIIGWAGMRGVVSLAAALSIPLMLTSGEVFPQRNLILFITFVTIFITLVLQGLTMSSLIRLFNVKEIDNIIPEPQQLNKIHVRMARISINYLDENHFAEVNEIPKLNRFHQQLHHIVESEENIPVAENGIKESEEKRKQIGKIFLKLVEVRRDELVAIRRENVFDDEVVREYEHILDLEEARIRV